MIPLKDNIPTGRFAYVTFSLIVANFVIYILAIRHGGSFISGPSATVELKYGAIPYALTHPGDHCGFIQSGAVACQGQPHVHGTPPNTIPTWQTVFTAMFMHASLIHIAGNMLFLWIFGNNVEAAMGRVKYVCFYILGGVAALALQVAIAPNSTAPTLGASGAIAAVLGGYIVLYPRARVLTLVLIIFFFTVIAAACAHRARVVVHRAGGVRRRGSHHPGRERWGRLLRPRRRLCLWADDGQAAGHPAQTDRAGSSGLLTACGS